MILARAVFVVLGLSLLLIPLLAPQPERPAEEDGWFAVAVMGSFVFLMLTLYLVLPVGLRTPTVSPGGVLTAVTMRGLRQVRLDALTRVGAVEPIARGAPPTLYVWLRDAHHARILATFPAGRLLPAALLDGAAALAQRDPGAVSSRARFYLDLPGAPRWVRRWTQAAVTLVVLVAAVLALFALAGLLAVATFGALR